MIRQMLRGLMATESSSLCVDADTLAAWSDGTLRARERAAVESHASSCVRCQALLAAMARTTAPAHARRWWRTSALGWLVPIAAAAAGVVLWINFPRTTRLSQSAPPPASAAAASQTSLSAPVPPPVASAALRGEPTASPDYPAASKEAGARRRQTRPDEERAAAKEAAQSASQEALANTAPSGARDAAAAPPAVPAPAAAETTRQFAAGASAAAPKSQTPPRAMADVATSVTSREAPAKMEPARTEIVSPNPNIRWRILTDGSIERSIDGGRTWQTQSTVAPALTAGVAPSPTTCWLVGHGGIVVLSIDGRTWQRVPIPEAIDLTFITASDAANATVTAADGRTFSTLDGGKTWRLR
ncbi:MAG TPA: hypothetical protein VF219_12255 [Vicinamibacterales bacterium]